MLARSSRSSAFRRSTPTRWPASRRRWHAGLAAVIERFGRDVLTTVGGRSTDQKLASIVFMDSAGGSTSRPSCTPPCKQATDAGFDSLDRRAIGGGRRHPLLTGGARSRLRRGHRHAVDPRPGPRVIERDGASEAEGAAAPGRTASIADKISRADFVIHTDGRSSRPTSRCGTYSTAPAELRIGIDLGGTKIEGIASSRQREVAPPRGHPARRLCRHPRRHRRRCRDARGFARGHRDGRRRNPGTLSPATGLVKNAILC